MYLHLGADVVIRLRDVVGIFDMENATVGRSTRAFLAGAQRAGRVVSVTGETPSLPKSFVVCASPGGETVYLTQISSATLRKRMSGFARSRRGAHSAAATLLSGGE